MKKINNRYVLSPTDIKRAEAHTRALARKTCPGGSVQAWFDWETGEVWYREFYGNSTYLVEGYETIQHICTVRRPDYIVV